jgi:hypothetical protein
VGLIWQLNQLAKIYKPIPIFVVGKNGKKEKVYRGLPSLILESDIIDITSYSEVDTRNKIDAFIETLESIRLNKAA